MSRERALVLVEQQRYDLAERELRHALAQEPGDADAHALLALCLAHRDALDEAQREADQAVGLSPDSTFAHSTRARVLYDRNRYQEAAEAVSQAIQREPNEASHVALLAAIRYDQRRWRDALEAADRGLTLDPEHPGCLNLRAMALGQLGDARQAETTLKGALAKDPENALTHANHAWGLLRRGDRGAALVHFREALRLDPELEWARAGIVEALKAEHAIYGVLLRYFFWMSRLSGRAQWAVVIAGYVAFQWLRQLARTIPALGPVLWPVIILYLLFAVMTWIGPALFDLVLRLNRFGRLALSRDQRVASNLLAATLGISALEAGTWLFSHSDAALLGAALFLILAVPIAATFRCERGWPRRVMAGWTVAVATATVASVVLAGTAVLAGRSSSAAETFFVLALVGAIGSPWIGNFLISQRPMR
jgi:tetratricopeptide (TPR) repeat protein